MLKILTICLVLLFVVTRSNADERKIVDYGNGYNMAVEQNKPHVTWVGKDYYYPTWFAGAVTSTIDKLDGYSEGDIIISLPKGDGGMSLYAIIKNSDGNNIRNIEDTLKKANSLLHPTHLPLSSSSCPNGQCPQQRR